MPEFLHGVQNSEKFMTGNANQTEKPESATT
jgi:hypothetical protein